MISIQALTYHYPDGRRALHSFTANIQAGERVGIVGSNGAGKSTLLLCLMGVFACRGSIQILGLDPTTARAQLAGKIGLVFQQVDDQLIAPTVLEDVAFAPLNLGVSRELARERANTALHQVGLAGYEDRITLNLSEGEKRRVAIAGVLAMQPEILLLDEPSAGLDPKRRRELISLLNTINCTKVIASHDAEFLRQTCDTIWLMNNGELITTGSHTLLDDTDLLRDNGL